MYETDEIGIIQTPKRGAHTQNQAAHTQKKKQGPKPSKYELPKL